MNVLVTGGAGFIGSHLVRQLCLRGDEVTVLDNFRNGREENLDANAIRVIRGDITDPETCRRACNGMDVVFHLACLGVRHSLHNPLENHQVNALGSLLMLEAARKASVCKFVYASTSEVYGCAQEFPICESTTTWPLTVYGASKLAGEHYARAYFECFRLPVVRVRPFNNYGPNSHFEGDSGEVIPRFILRVLAGQPPVIFGDGSQTRDFLYVTDCARALIGISESDNLIGEVVNLGLGKEVRIDDLAQAVLRITNRSDLSPIFVQERPADVPRLWVDTSKLRQTIDFAPETSLEEGLSETLAYFRNLFHRNPSCLDQIDHFNWQC